jgi:hypothetical protein
MSDEYVDGVAQLLISDEATFATLPLPVAQRILLALPVDARGRACCVCRAWRDALAEPSLWTRLDMSFAGALKGRYGAEAARFFAMLHGAAGRAHGQLRQLELSQQHVEWFDLLPVLTANAGSLRKLYLHNVHPHFNSISQPPVEAVMAAAPLLQVLAAEIVTCTWAEAPRMLRAEPPYAVLQMRCTLSVTFRDVYDYGGGMERVTPFAAALADATLQPALLNLRIKKAETAQPAVMDALVDAALARRLRELSFEYCTPPAAAPLARLLAEGSLAVLEVTSRPLEPLFDAAGAALVADALRVNTTLTRLKLSWAGLCVDMRVAGALLGALQGHPSLRELHITCEYTTSTTMEDRSAFGAALGELVAADVPALRELVCYGNSLGDAGLAPIVEALVLNHHLRRLNICSNGMSEAFARERLLPAVRANTALCSLHCAESTESAAWKAMELVRCRGQRG